MLHSISNMSSNKTNTNKAYMVTFVFANCFNPKEFYYVFQYTTF